MNFSSKHLEVLDSDSRVGEEALANADLNAGLLHPLLQIVQRLRDERKGRSETDREKEIRGGDKGWMSGAQQRGVKKKASTSIKRAKIKKLMSDVKN